MTHLCVSIFVNDGAQVHRDIAKAAEAGADMVELRTDQFTDPPDTIPVSNAGKIRQIEKVIENAVIPCIVTCRPLWEGGSCELPEHDRREFLHGASEDAAYIDLELKAFRHDAASTDLPRENRPGLILSFHDFTRRPDRLYNLISEMNATSAEVIKIAWLARTIRDNLEAFEILKTRQKPTIALCMGEAGLMSRVLAKKFGGFLSFASLDSSGGTAPGQISISDMKNLYRWDAINEKTKVYGVVGSPVMHSMSPAIHNTAFSAVGHDGVYLPMLVEPSYESFKAFMESFLHFEGFDLAGLSITLPHKENALRYLQEKHAEIDPLALTIGAVNTILINPSPSSAGTSPLTTGNWQLATLQGINTDYAAILDSITAKLNITRDDLANYRVAVIGAGGAGRTAVAALAHYGATVVIYNRTKERADALAEEFNGKNGRVVSARMEKLCDSCCHIFINTTSVGMYPSVDQSPLGDRPPAFTPDTLVFDTIYNPMKTKFLQQAEQAGAKTISGVEMFLSQAAAQFEAWTGKNAPTELMRSVIERKLMHS